MNAKIEELSEKRDEAFLRRIWRRHELGNITDIELLDVPRGLEGVMRGFMINNSQMIRLPAEDTRLPKTAAQYIQNEILALNALSKSDVPCMKLLAHNGEVKGDNVAGSYIITTILEGQILSTAYKDASTAEQNRLARQAGDMLARLHSSSRFARFGSLYQLNKAGHLRWSDAIMDYAGRYAAMAKKSGLIDTPTLNALKSRLDEGMPALSTTIIGALCHGWLSFDNFIVRNGHVAGVINFGDARSGDPIFDLRYDKNLESRNHGALQPFMDGYQVAHSLSDGTWQKLKLYRLLLSLEMSVEALKRGDKDTARANIKHFKASL